MSHVITGSGYLNNPVRTILIADDNRPGTYPVDVSPVVASESGQYMKPYRDNIVPDTLVPYAQAEITINSQPEDGDSVTLTNALGGTSQFKFTKTSSPFVISPGTYSVSLQGISKTPTDRDRGLSSVDIVKKRALERLVYAINDATGSLITAAATPSYNKAVITQCIPGTAGNVSNTSSTARITAENFTGGNEGVVRYPFGISSEGSDEVFRRVIATADSGTLDVPAAGKASLLSAPSDQHPYGIYLPYNETNSVQAFGSHDGSLSYGTQAHLYDDFYTRGSVSGSLDESLFNKDKIVIDLTPVTSTMIQEVSDAQPGKSQYTMMYFNFESKTWEPIGRGIRTVDVTSTPDLFDSLYMGFSPTAWSITVNSALLLTFDGINILDEQLKSTFTGNKQTPLSTNFGNHIDTFGFPHHPKYHATSSQTLEVSSLVDRPFCVEKIVYQFSGSSETFSYTDESSPTAINVGANFVRLQNPGEPIFATFLPQAAHTFFILNQRKANTSVIGGEYTKVAVASDFMGDYLPPDLYSDNDVKVTAYPDITSPANQIPQTRQLSEGGSNVLVDDERDLLTYANIGSIWDGYKDEIEELYEPGFPHYAADLDLAIVTPVSSTFDGIYTVSAHVKAATKSVGSGNFNTDFVSGTASIEKAYVSKLSSTRNSIDTPTGRTIGSEFSGERLAYSIGDGSGLEFIGYNKNSIRSPYIIRPGDKLVFGWQSGFKRPDILLNQIPTQPLTIGPGAGKLILFGSYLKEDKPVHNIFKDQINSDAVHEMLPAGPWALDMFDTEPQMCFSGSMREEHVTGTMLTRSESGVITVTDASDFSIGGVRAVSARVSRGDVKQRWSFFRNKRAVDSNEQYYDSMQANPVKVLEVGGYKPIWFSTAEKPTQDDARVALNSLNWSNVDTKKTVLLGIDEPTSSAPIPLVPNEILLDSAGVTGSWSAFFDSATNKEFLTHLGAYSGDYSFINRVKKINGKLFKSSRTNGYEIRYKNSYRHLASLFPPISTGITPWNNNPNNTVYDWFEWRPSTNISLDGIEYYMPGVNTGNDRSNLFKERGITEVGIAGSNAYLPVASIDDTYIHKTFVDAVFGTSSPFIAYEDPESRVNAHMSIIFGCFGDGYKRCIQYKQGKFATQLISFKQPKYSYVSDMIYRGTRYGLINPTPLFTNSVFSATNFGNLRDMLEQRQYTRFSLGDNTLTTPAVTVQFIDRSAAPGTVVITSGSGTNSSNISPFATSEYPYDDSLSDYNQIWDRNTVLPEVLAVLPP